MINILIADDYPARYRKLIDRLEEVGINSEHIDIVTCANKAREQMESKTYDLLILDILLPLREEEQPLAQHSLDLLAEIVEADYPNKPHRVIGITSDRSTAHENSSKFEEWTWIVVEHRADSSDWIERIVNCTKYASEIKDIEKNISYSVDLAIICTLQKELDAVLKLPWNWTESRPLDDVVFVRDGKFEVDGKTITVSATCSPRMGMISSALRSAAVITLLKPRLIVMCGICAGVKGKVKIGDVIFADPTWDFQSGKRVKDKVNSTFSMSPHQLCPSTLIRSHAEQLINDSDAMAGIAAAFPNSPSLPKLIIGPMASGSAVLADGEVIEEIKYQHRELLGVEMEAYGMFAAAYFSSRPQPLPFAIKAVCDFADPDKEDQHQDFAAYTSACVLRILMERYGPRLLS